MALPIVISRVAPGRRSFWLTMTTNISKRFTRGAYDEWSDRMLSLNMYRMTERLHYFYLNLNRRNQLGTGDYRRWWDASLSQEDYNESSGIRNVPFWRRRNRGDDIWETILKNDSERECFERHSVEYVYRFGYMISDNKKLGSNIV
jgi:hypothetical protein